MARAGRDEPSVRSEPGRAEQRCRAIIVPQPASPATSTRGVGWCAFRRRGRAVRDRDPCGARAGRRLRARAPHRHGTLSADPRFGRVLPPLPRPSRGLVRATPGSPDALPGRCRNRLPRHDERAEGDVGRGHGADPRVVRDQRLRRTRTAAGVTRRRAVVPAEEGRVRGAAHHPAGRRTLFERLGQRRGRDDAGAQRALARGRCRQRRRHRGQARRRAGARRLAHHRVLPAGGRHERPRRCAGDRFAHRFRRRRRGPPGARKSQFPRSARPQRRDRARGHARARGGLRPCVRVPRG